MQLQALYGNPHAIQYEIHIYSSDNTLASEFSVGYPKSSDRLDLYVEPVAAGVEIEIPSSLT